MSIIGSRSEVQAHTPERLSKKKGQKNEVGKKTLELQRAETHSEI